MTDKMELSDNARTIFDKRYAIKDDKGGPTETPEQTAWRVAENVATVTALYAPDGDVQIVDQRVYPWKTLVRQAGHLHREPERPTIAGVEAAAKQADRYYQMLLRRDFFPNSPTWTGAGTGLGQLAACFVLPIDDDLANGRASIFETLKVAAAIQQTGGGNGFSFGRLRPNKTLVKRSMGRASGPVGFLHTYDAAFGWIAQGGTRRGANMGVLPVHHPDIRQFIAAKTEEGAVENFNISVAITDEFMKAVEKDGEFDLRWDGKTVETIQARDLFNTLISDAWKLGDPGSLFIDRANQFNPCPTRYVLEATNPCGEQWLPPYSNCCLGSINLLNFANWEGAGNRVIVDGWQPSFDWERLRQTTVLAQNFLDDVVDANAYVNSVPELAAAAMGERRIGLGIMGLADAMAVMGLAYDSEEGREFASQVMEYVQYHTMLASIERARERGPFEWYPDSIYDLVALDDTIVGADGLDHEPWQSPTPLVSYERDFGRPTVNWDNVRDGIIEHGIRNACLMTIAPTGTISNVADLQGSGGEPFFGLAYDRILTQDEQKITLTYANPLLAEALRRTGSNEEEIVEIARRIKANSGSALGVEGVPFEVQRAFPVSADVTPENHVRMQATLQRFVDNSISKTINMPNLATVEDVGNVYRLAFDLGCKGITIYRQGSRVYEVLSTGPKDQVVEDTGDDWAFVHPHKIPEYAATEGLPSRTFPVQTPFGTAQVYITELTEHPGRPFDIRVGFGKAGNDKLADVEALGRSLSISLRAGVPVEVLVDQMEGIGGQTVMGFGPNRTRSVADGIARLLRNRYMEPLTEQIAVTPIDTPLKESREPVADPTLVCPACHLATVVSENGCQRCETRLGGCGDFYKCD